MCKEKLEKTFTVAPEDLATAVGSGSVEVLATPKVAAMMENTAAELAQKILEREGETQLTTVGTWIALSHDAPSPEGSSIRVEAVLEEREGRMFSFSLEAWDQWGSISKGTHRRAAVNREKFAAKAQERKKTL